MGVEIQLAVIGIFISIWGAWIVSELKELNKNLKKLIRKQEDE